MAATRVVTDSTAYLPPEIVSGNGIGIVSLYVNFGGDRTERETDLLNDLDSFYDGIRSAEQWPTTSQPSVGDFVAAYEPLLANGDEIVSIHISEGISGTCDSARQAAELLEREGKGGERVRVVDSQSAAGGMGLIVLGAARAAQGGGDSEAVAARAQEVRESLRMWFAVDTLEFLKRSGRIGAASAWIGSTLKIKPILTLEQEITPIERVRTSARAFERLVAYAEERHAAGANGWVVQHIQSREAADRLAERCREIFERDPMFVSEVGPVLGVHSGPGLLGVGGVPADSLSP
ncbi:MAG TPA: DegV family protein [Thermoleophilaceae bacterium]|nr:DegV family protein [Thermoleophilaceae bacterium]